MFTFEFNHPVVNRMTCEGEEDLLALAKVSHRLFNGGRRAKPKSSTANRITHKPRTKGNGSKSALIREYLIKNPDATPLQVSKALTAGRRQVTAQLVSQVRSVERSKK